MFRGLAAFEREYLAFVARGGLGPAELSQLGALAGDIFAESQGPYSLVAYVLRSILLDLAQRLDGEPVPVELADHLFDTLTGPVEAAINGLKGPITEETAAQLSFKLLDARRRFF